MLAAVKKCTEISRRAPGFEVVECLGQVLHVCKITVSKNKPIQFNHEKIKQAEGQVSPSYLAADFLSQGSTSYLPRINCEQTP